MMSQEVVEEVVVDEEDVVVAVEGLVEVEVAVGEAGVVPHVVVAAVVVVASGDKPAQLVILGTYRNHQCCSFLFPCLTTLIH